MAVTRIRRQVLLFLLGVLVPGVVLLAFGLMLIGQEAELSQRRDADALSIRARTMADSLESWLDAGFAATNDSLRAGVVTRHPARSSIVLVGTYSDGAYRDGVSQTSIRKPLTQTGHDAFVRTAQRREFALGDRRGAITALRARIRSEHDSTRASDLRVRLARALFAANQSGPAAAQAQLVMQQGPDVRDEFDTPLALYAADMLVERSLPDEVCDRMGEFAATDSWLTEAAAAYLADLTQRAGCGRTPNLDALLAETRLAARVATVGDRLITDRTGERWFALDDDWLVRKVDADRREPEAVVAILVADIATWLAAAGIESVSVAGTSSLMDERERLLAPEFSRLRVVFPPAIRPAISRRTLFGLAILLVLLMTGIGGYLLWRDLRRENRLLALQTQFVASVSHELRTPLTSIRLFSETMLEYDSVDREQQEHGLRVIAHESGRLSRMLNNVLNTTRVERGTMTYQLAPGDLADAAENAIEAMRHEYDQAGMTVERDLGMARGTFDPDAMEQAVLNLLSNALKYASSGGRVAVRSWEEAGCAAVSVRDFGPGIAIEEQDRVFERFYRLNGNTNVRIPGAGLGLALVRHIAEGNGGMVILVSDPGSGCEFTIRLPLYQ